LGPAADTSNAPGFSWSGDSNTGIYRPATDAVGLVTGGVERMRVLANGNVGIGTTNPLSKLEVNTISSLVGGDPTYKGDIRLISQGGGSILNGAGGIEFKLSNSGPGYGWRINAPDATGASEGTPLSIQSRMGSATWSNNLIIKGDGNVGIGTTNPQAKLHVEGNIKTTTNSTNYASGTGSYLTINSGTPTTVVSASTITTSGKPVFVMCSGDVQPLNGTSDYIFMRLYRDSTAIGQSQVNHPGSMSSTNQSFAIHFIDVVSAGTYTYNLKAWIGSGSMNFGETGFPYISVIEFM